MVLPILILMIVGLINLGILITSQIILIQASWEGARTGATLDPAVGEGDAEITGSIQASLVGILHPEEVVITIEPNELDRSKMESPLPRGHAIKVALDYPIQVGYPFPITVPLHAEATSRIEYSNPP